MNPRDVDARALIAAGIEVLEREAMLLDERRWDDWLALYAPDCEYWAPAWRSDGTPTEDPRMELSHVYCASRAGLEDRILRIRSGRSPASTPAPRTTHLLGGMLPLEPPSPERLRLRSSWVCHVFFPRSNDSHAFFGRSEHALARLDGDWKIAKKKILLQNDYLPGMLDIYCM